MHAQFDNGKYMATYFGLQDNKYNVSFILQARLLILKASSQLPQTQR